VWKLISERLKLFEKAIQRKIFVHEREYVMKGNGKAIPVTGREGP
jgi:hypothetical protein